jgi:hypothetical protein
MITNFSEFRQFLAKKLALFLEKQCYDQFLHKLAVCSYKNAICFAKFYAETVSRIIAI